MVKNYRVVVFGVKGVGKTAILEQAIYGHFSKNYVSILQTQKSVIIYYYCLILVVETVAYYRGYISGFYRNWQKCT